MSIRFSDKNKVTRAIWWTLFVAIIVLFVWIISKTFLKDVLVNSVLEAIIGKNTVLNESFLHQYQMFYITVPVLAVFAFCIFVLLVSLLIKKYKKADWIFAIVSIVVVMCAATLPNIPLYNRANSATHDVLEMVVDETYLKEGFRSHTCMVRLEDGTEVRVRAAQYVSLEAGDSVYVVYFEDYEGQTPVVFTEDIYSLPA